MIEQRFRQKMEKRQNDQASIWKGKVHKVSDARKARNSEDGDPKTIRNHEDRGRIRSIITVNGHKVMRNLSEPSDQTLMHLDVNSDYLCLTSPQTPLKAIRTLLTKDGGK